MLGSSQLHIIPASGGANASGLHGKLYSYVHTPTPTYVYIIRSKITFLNYFQRLWMQSYFYHCSLTYSL